MSKLDIVIKGGTVVDGLQTPRYKADVGIADGRVVQIGRVDAADAAEVVDGSGTTTASCSGIHGAPCRAGTV